LTVIAAMKRVHLELWIDQNGSNPLYNKSSLVGPTHQGGLYDYVTTRSFIP